MAAIKHVKDCPNLAIVTCVHPLHVPGLIDKAGAVRFRCVGLLGYSKMSLSGSICPI